MAHERGVWVHLHPLPQAQCCSPAVARSARGCLCSGVRRCSVPQHRHSLGPLPRTREHPRDRAHDIPDTCAPPFALQHPYIIDSEHMARSWRGSSDGQVLVHAALSRPKKRIVNEAACAAAAGRPHPPMCPRWQLSPLPSACSASPAPLVCCRAGPPAGHAPPETGLSLGQQDRKQHASCPGSSAATPEADEHASAVAATCASVMGMRAEQTYGAHDSGGCLHHCLQVCDACILTPVPHTLSSARVSPSEHGSHMAAHLGSSPVACIDIQPR